MLFHRTNVGALADPESVQNNGAAHERAFGLRFPILCCLLEKPRLYGLLMGSIEG